jgi:hypothetical protein
MEAETTMTEVSEEDLRQAGASSLFAHYYDEAPDTASAVREVDRGPFSLDELAERPHLGGHFFEALWNGHETRAVRRADGQNREILQDVFRYDIERHL